MKSLVVVIILVLAMQDVAYASGCLTVTGSRASITKSGELHVRVDFLSSGETIINHDVSVYVDGVKEYSDHGTDEIEKDSYRLYEDIQFPSSMSGAKVRVVASAKSSCGKFSRKWKRRVPSIQIA
jgi:hypothetical protein